MKRAGGVAILAIISLIAGCVSPAPTATLGATPAATHARPTVVALLDAGVNPYHEAFAARPGAPAALETIPGLQATPVALAAQGSFEERVEQDGSFWSSIQPETLYAFHGTRLLAISMGHSPSNPRIVDDEAGTGSHGTRTASLVAREDPAAVVVMVQVDDTVCNLARAQDDCPVLSPSLAKGMDWAASQPWIDVVSVSIAVPGNLPVDPEAHPEVAAYLAASRRAHEAGKMVVNGAGNSVVPPLADHYNGPPWVIAVGGVEAVQNGEAPAASKVVDVVANYTEWTADGGTTDGYAWASGTSFGTPIVAGTLSRALFEIRAALGHREGILPDGAMAEGAGIDGAAQRVTSHDLRDALNASATYFAPTDWSPTRPVSNETYRQLLTHSLPVVVPFAQMGWGYVHGGLAGEIAARVLAGDLAPPAGKALAAQYQAQAQAAREAYWSRA